MSHPPDISTDSSAQAGRVRSECRKMGASQLHVVSVTAAGKTHEYNEDAVSENAEKLLFCVADGISNSRGGSEAARHASQIAAKYLTRQEEVLNDGTAMAQFTGAHLDVGRETGQGGGASAVALRMSGSRASIYHVGDCRAYVIRRAEGTEGPVARAITNDHVLPTTPERAGEPGGLGQALGHWVFEVGRHHVRLAPGDAVVLCTDGIYKAEGSEVFLRSLAAMPERELEVALRQHAVDCALQGDDATVVHVRYRGILNARPWAWLALCASMLFAFAKLGGFE